MMRLLIYISVMVAASSALDYPLALPFLPLVLGGLHHVPKCKQDSKIVEKDICKPYTKQSCFTAVEQKCKDVFTPNCKAVIEHVPQSKCFTVQDLTCGLIEKPLHKTVLETAFEQECLTETAEVCNLIHKTVATPAGLSDCIMVERSKCWKEKKIVKDIECCYTMVPKCENYIDGQRCSLVPKNDCKVIPRTMYEERCQPVMVKECKNLRYLVPKVVKENNCRSDPIKKCIVQKKLNPKQVTEYIYNKKCKSTPKKVCEKADHDVLKKTCDKTKSQVCNYIPKKHCKSEKLKHCYKVNKVVYNTTCGKHSYGKH